MRLPRAILLGALGVALAAPAPATEDRGPVTRHALWKVEGGRSAVYLLGSIHLLRRQHYPLERPIEEAFDEARVVAFETDVEAARARSVAAHEEHPAARGILRRQVSAQTYRAVVRYLESAGEPGALLDDLPAARAAGALVQIELRNLGFDPEWGVDAYYYRRARKYGKTVVPLEGVRDAPAVPATAPDGDALVAATLADVAALRPMLRDLVRAWKAGDVDRLETMVNGAAGDRPDVYGPLLAERNARWMPKIEALLAGDAPAMVIVGAGHLVGSDNLVSMLQSKGYEVRQQ